MLSGAFLRAAALAAVAIGLIMIAFPAVLSAAI